MRAERLRLLETVRASVLGDDRVIAGPWGPVRLVYADYTASGRALGFIEDWIRAEVLPLYANTHTESSWTGRQTNRFREDARRLIRDAVGGGDEDAVIFCGAGATGAIDKLLGILELRLPAGLDAAWGFRAQLPERERPVVFLGPYEHHSNELPWRESIADVVVIDEDHGGGPDLAMLARALRAHAGRRLRLGSFSAASNVTGLLTDVPGVTRVLHEHGALAFWDYAAAAPYVPIEVSPHTGRGEAADRLAGLDAVFLSPHKFVGGPGTPGVLVVKRRLLQNRVPVVPGGGTVAYVGPREHVYIADPELREEGGTPAIVGAIRAGLVLQLKQRIGTDLIHEREASFVSRVLGSWGRDPQLFVLGNPQAPRLAIVSFLVRHGSGFLHHHFVVSLLNDLFGIQGRSGCSCAGPYGHRLLGIDLETSQAFEAEILRGHEGIKPGWTRVGFNWFVSETVFEYVVEAVHLVARLGWRLLPDYRFEPATGMWTHRRGTPPPRRLSEVRYEDGRLRFAAQPASLPEDALPAQLERARRILEAGATDAAPVEEIVLDAECERLRWFPLPHEVQAELAGRSAAPALHPTMHLGEPG
jgi:selenocysteine lyase/cysteine desulfurase